MTLPGTTPKYRLWITQLHVVRGCDLTKVKNHEKWVDL